jgi:hypothetical protein
MKALCPLCFELSSAFTSPMVANEHLKSYHKIVNLRTKEIIWQDFVFTDDEAVARK